MIRRNSSGEYEFKLNYPSAQEVVLVGDFEACDQVQIPMARSPSGDWVCRLHLREGVYHFKYWVDGNWCLDEEPFATPAASFLTSSLVVRDQQGTPYAYMG